MKRMTRFTTLLLALMTVLMMSQAAFAENTNVKGGTYTYYGNKEIVTSDVDDLEATLRGLEPGDSITIKQTYANESDKKTEWYIRNEILDTLETSSEMNGGYSYKLVSGGKTLFDSDAVGGEDSASSKEGLEQVNDGITGEDAGEEWIHIDTLAPGASGTTTLKVALDGESQANEYMTTDAELNVRYAVEDVAQGRDIVKIKKIVDTGDTTNLILPIAIFLAALALLVLAFFSYKKDRKDGEEA